MKLLFRWLMDLCQCLMNDVCLGREVDSHERSIHVWMEKAKGKFRVMRLTIT